jgi:hypothetical protein
MHQSMTERRIFCIFFWSMLQAVTVHGTMSIITALWEDGKTRGIKVEAIAKAPWFTTCMAT